MSWPNDSQPDDTIKSMFHLHAGSHISPVETHASSTHWWHEWRICSPKKATPKRAKIVRIKTRKMPTLQICGSATMMHCTSTRRPRIRCIERSGRIMRTRRKVPTTGKAEKTSVTKPVRTTSMSIQFQPECRYDDLWPHSPSAVILRTISVAKISKKAKSIQSATEHVSSPHAQ